MGSDFICYYAASQKLLAGDFADVYNVYKLHEVEEKLTNDPHTPIMAWFYPPTFAVLVYPFAIFPYVPILYGWLGITMLGYIIVIRKIAPHPYALGLALAFPGTFQNFIHGQNGFFIAYLLGQGILLLDKHPRFAGILLGLLVLKPHLGVLVGIALLAGKKWDSLATAGASAMTLIISSIAMFGVGSWKAFFASMSSTTFFLENGYLPWDKMSSFFAAARLLGVDTFSAYILQIIIFGLLFATVFRVWLKGASNLSCIVLTCSIILATPYSYHYDLTIVGLAIAWYGWEGFNKGWLPGERWCLAIAWLAPLINSPIALLAKVQIMPLVLLSIVLFALRRLVVFGSELQPS